jgi:hypothetical protein
MVGKLDAVFATVRYQDVTAHETLGGVIAFNSLKILVAHTGLEPVISALRGQRVNQLHQCAVGSEGWIICG